MQVVGQNAHRTYFRHGAGTFRPLEGRADVVFGGRGVLLWGKGNALCGSECCGAGRFLFQEAGLGVEIAVTDALVDGVDLPAEAGLLGHGPGRLGGREVGRATRYFGVVAGDEQASLESAGTRGH